MIEIKSLKSLSLSEIVELFNLSFADYLLPVHLTDKDFTNKLKVENIQLLYSAGAFDVIVQ